MDVVVFRIAGRKLTFDLVDVGCVVEPDLRTGKLVQHILERQPDVVLVKLHVALPESIQNHLDNAVGELLPVEDILEFLIDRVLAGGGVVLKVGHDLRNINPVVRDRIGVVLFY